MDGGKGHDNSKDVTLTLKRTSKKAGSTEETVSDATISWNGDTYTYSDLQQYDAEGYEYEYSVEEAAIDGYKTVKDDYNFTNTITGTTSVSGTKTWIDGGKDHDNNKDVTLTLKRTSKKAGSTEETVSDATISWNGDTYTYSDLQQYDAEGYEYEYSVEEAAIDGYKTVKDDYNFTNTITGTTSVSGTKTWIDGGKDHDNNKDVTLTLKRTSSKAGSEEETVSDATISWEGNKYTYSALPKYDAEGYEYTYSVTETVPTGYTLIQDGYNLTNTITHVSVSKVDINDQYELPNAHIQIIDSAGKIVDEWDSSTEAYIITGLLVNEEYVLHETVAPNGYTIAADTTFTIDETGMVKVGETVVENGHILIEDAPTKVTVSKTDITGEEELAGAHIQIIDSNGDVIDEWDSTDEPYIIEMLLVNEEYTLRETVAPDGYAIAADTTFTIDKTGKVTIGETVVENGHILIKDDLTKVTVSKKAVTEEKELPGAEIKLLRKATSADGDDADYLDDTKEYVVVEKWISGTKEHEIQAKLERNIEYILRETVAPNGYTIAADTKFSIDDTGRVVSGGMIVENGYILIEDALTEVTVSKQDIAKGEELPGATIQILDEEGNVVREWTSGNKPEKISGLEMGKTYTLHEEVAPLGYTIAADMTFSIDKQGNVNTTGTKTEGGALLINDALTEVTVSKKDIAKGEELPGATIQILDEKGNVIKEWISGEKPVKISGLETGKTYTLHEEVAPLGYTIAADTTFSIDEQGNVSTTGTKTEGGALLINDVLTEVTVSKKDIAKGEELPGATIQILDEKGNVVKEWTSGEKPVKISGLETGKTYTLHEEVAPLGYTIAADTTFSIDEQGNVSTTGTKTEGGALLINDALTEVTVSKQDIAKGEELPGATIQILDEKGNVVKEWTSGEKPVKISGLETGKTYTLHEEVAPLGYTIAADTTFSIDKQGNVSTTGTKTEGGALLINDALTEVTVSKQDVAKGEELPGATIQILDEEGNVVKEWTSGNKPEKISGLETGKTYTLHEEVAPLGYTIAADTTFSIDKQGNVSTTGTKTEGGALLINDALTEVTVSKQDIAKGEELPGATIQILDEEGNVVKEWTSGNKPEKISGLETGKTYTLHEEVAPLGYTIAADTTFSIDKQGNVSTTGTKTEGGALLINDALTEVTVSKQDIAKGEELPRATIQILDSEGNVVKEWTSGEKPVKISGLETGKTYTLHEEVAPLGYTIAADTTFSIDKQGNVSTTGTKTEDGALLINDALTKVVINKTDIANGKELEGAIIIVLDSEGKQVDCWVSKMNETHEIEGLKTSEEYTLKETVAPEGYTIATETTFTIDETGKVTTTGTVTEDGVLLVEDSKTSVKVSKVDIADGEELPGATIQIIDSEGNVVEEWVSTDEAHTIEGLKTGEKYILRETVAPEGYTTATDTKFTIDENGKVTSTGSVTEDDILLVEDALTKVAVTKKDIESGEELAGAHFQVIDNTGKAVEEWDSTATAHTIEGLKTGEGYTLRETVAPTGYTVTTDIAFTIDQTGMVMITGKRSANANGSTEIVVKDAMTKISVSKVDIADGEELEGATIQIIDSQGKVAEEWISAKEPHVIEGLKTGTEYTLRETVAPEGYAIAADTKFTIDKTGKVTSGGTEVEDGYILIKDDLIRKTGDLVITNTVISDDPADKDKEFEYTIELDDKTINGTYGDVTFEDGVAKITLKDGEKATITDLPVDTKYTVTQKDEDGFTVEKTGDTGTISEDPSQADFVNTKETKTVDLVITNTVISDDDSDKEKDFEFTIELEDKTINGTYGDVTFEDGAAKITLKDGEKATITDLPVDTKYTVTQKDEDGFTVEKTGDNGTIHEGFGQADFINRIERKTRTTSSALKKAWDDENDRDGVRPLKVTVDLLANGAVIRTIDLTKESHWMAVIRNLPEADAEGKTIAYTWTERDPGSGYKLTGSVTKGTLTTLTNSRDPEVTEIRFEQKWEDKDDAYGTRPDQIRVQLYEDGEPCGDEVILNAKEGWKHTWTDVKKNRGGRETVYTVRVLDVPDAYRSVTTGDAGSGFVNTSAVERGSLVIRKTFDIEIPEKEETPETELRDITVRKVWEDNDNRDGNRPENVTVHLLAGGEKIRTAVLKAENGWKYTFTNLPKTARGKGITYSVTEDPVTDYICKVNGFTIRNIYRPETTTATVRKVWDDDNNRQGIRPKSIRMTLSNGKTVTLNKANGWQATITGLPKRLNGQEARYTWTEQNVLGYQLQSVSTTGTVTTFTNELFRIPEIPESMKPKKMPSGTWKVFEGYDTPLGVETIINHVGDCFD
ncbi:Cna B-type domain-containing protein [Clostridiales bacterium]|nr:Cna B-type domain-containing protein [Clostridiales bacterium]